MEKPVLIEERTRAQIAAFLPEAIALTISAYKKHMTEMEKDGKEVVISTHHKDAKVIISHIELLIKLARWADLPDKKIEASAEAALLESLMQRAEAEIEAYDEGEE